MHPVKRLVRTDEMPTHVCLKHDYWGCISNTRNGCLALFHRISLVRTYVFVWSYRWYRFHCACQSLFLSVHDSNYVSILTSESFENFLECKPNNSLQHYSCNAINYVNYSSATLAGYAMLYQIFGGIYVPQNKKTEILRISLYKSS